MLKVHRIINVFRNSCTYILYIEGDKRVWLIDCGDYSLVKAWSDFNRKKVAGVFLTHSHCDHTFGLNELIKDYPDIPIYLSASGGIECLHNTRLNMSRFTATPYVVISENFVQLADGAVVNILDDVLITAYHTKGHSTDSIIYKADNYLFTGDAYIPSLDVVTKLPGGNIIQSKHSMDLINNLITKDELIVMPGHNLLS